MVAGGDSCGPTPHWETITCGIIDELQELFDRPGPASCKKCWLIGMNFYCWGFLALWSRQRGALKRTSLPTRTRTRDAVLVSWGPWSVWVVLFQTHTQASSLYYVLTLTLSALTMHVDIQYFFPQSRVIFSAGLHSTSARLFEQLQQ